MSPRSLADVRAAFGDPEEFWSSPLYRRLCTVVALDPYLIGLAGHTRDGQVPTFALFGAVHALLLDGAAHPLADYYASRRDDDAAPPDDAGPAFTDFARRYETELIAMLSTRLVQTNHVRRAVGLRIALATIAPRIGDRRAHLLEIGCSAGLLMRHARYGYRLDERAFGDRTSPVQLTSEWRSAQPVPDLDAIPNMVSTCGIDPNPLDPSIETDRRWLEALVWPEDRDKAVLLSEALALAARHPVEIITGQAQTACAEWSSRLGKGDVRIVFHCATRMHVPARGRPQFDQAVRNVGRHGPLYHVAIEGDGIQIAEPGQPLTRRFDCEGHLAWVAPARPQSSETTTEGQS